PRRHSVQVRREGLVMITYDAIVVGSGITGGWAAKELTEKGLRTLMIERGRDVVHRKDYITEHKPSWELPLRDARLSMGTKRAVVQLRGAVHRRERREAGPGAAPRRRVPAPDGDERRREPREGGDRAGVSGPARDHRAGGDSHAAAERPAAVPLLRPVRARLLDRVVLFEPVVHAAGGARHGARHYPAEQRGALADLRRRQEPRDGRPRRGRGHETSSGIRGAR